MLVLCSVYYHQSDQGEEKCWLRSNQTTRWEQRSPPLAFFHYRKNKTNTQDVSIYHLSGQAIYIISLLWSKCMVRDLSKLLHFWILLRLKHSTTSEVSYYTDEAELSLINLCILHNSGAYKLVGICWLCCGLQTAATRSIFEAYSFTIGTTKIALSVEKRVVIHRRFQYKIFLYSKKHFAMTAVRKQLKKTNQIFLYYLWHPEQVCYWVLRQCYVLCSKMSKPWLTFKSPPTQPLPY